MEAEAIAAPPAGPMDGPDLGAAVLLEEVSARDMAEAADMDMEGVSDGALDIRPRAHGMEGLPTVLLTR